MARSYTVNGQKLTDKQIPAAYGTEEYYRFLANWTAKAKGQTYDKSAELLKLERSMAADKTATADSMKEQDWKDAHDATAAAYAEANAKYLQGQTQYEADNLDLARQRDRTGKAAVGYHKVIGPDGQAHWEYAGSGYDESDADTSNDYATDVSVATAQGVAAAQGQLGGTGKYGAAGNANSAGPIDNSWNDADGTDVRTDKQIYYDRNLENIHQQSDANGTYSWYADETGYDANDPNAKRVNLNLSELASRQTAPEGVDAGKGVNNNFDRSEFWNYNGGTGNSAWYDEQVRNRANKSTYARTV